ncbi:hypothetical protein LZD49_33540 [Dyadobacter sp. CY261]|uniref:hypothetical protein n=1 Tax=Dyadobacter sp. CY261 TaxID=2907203 RepID=UPI001F35C265|nr:hypothetical protein [Dyadobacter sp. CY261]MCF0075451.1 hypothetical protein [Dyadobacter sp. CY261]
MSELYICERKVGGNDGLTKYYYYVPVLIDINKALSELEHPNDGTPNGIYSRRQGMIDMYNYLTGSKDVLKNPDNVNTTDHSLEDAIARDMYIKTDDARLKAFEFLNRNCQTVSGQSDIFIIPYTIPKEIIETIRQALKGGA